MLSLHVNVIITTYMCHMVVYPIVIPLMVLDLFARNPNISQCLQKCSEIVEPICFFSSLEE